MCTRRSRQLKRKIILGIYRLSSIPTAGYYCCTSLIYFQRTDSVIGNNDKALFSIVAESRLLNIYTALPVAKISIEAFRYKQTSVETTWLWFHSTLEGYLSRTHRRMLFSSLIFCTSEARASLALSVHAAGHLLTFGFLWPILFHIKKVIMRQPLLMDQNTWNNGFRTVWTCHGPKGLLRSVFYRYRKNSLYFFYRHVPTRQQEQH